MQVSTLRPGLLVSVRTSIKGNCSYAVTELEGEHMLANGMTSQARWETLKTVKDKDEHERASQARSKCRSVISAVCSQSAHHGLLCLQENRDKLEAACQEADRIVREFNSSAEVSALVVSVVVGEIAPDDVRAIRSINNELRELIDGMAQGLAELNVDKIRDAANRAKSMTGMLEANAKESVQRAIDVARKTAREIVKAAETGAAEVDKVAIARIVEARTSFLDLDEAGEIGAVETSGRAVDLAPIAEIKAAPAQGRMFDL